MTSLTKKGKALERIKNAVINDPYNSEKKNSLAIFAIYQEKYNHLFDFDPMLCSYAMAKNYFKMYFYNFLRINFPTKAYSY